MSGPIAGGSLFAIPFDPMRGDPARVSRLLTHMVDNTSWFAAGATPEEARANAMWLMTTPDDWRWEVWNGGTFAGMLLLSRISPKVDALFHFTLLPAKETGVTLFGSRKLMWNFLGYVFDQFQLQRITVEIPEHHSKLAHWFRQRLGFKYEGEQSLSRLTKWRGVTILDTKGAPAWIASQGSRKERAHWDGTKWADLTVLRMTRDEYETRRALGEMPQATREPQTNESSDDAAHSPSRRVQADATAGSSGGHPQATAGG